MAPIDYSKWSKNLDDDDDDDNDAPPGRPRVTKLEGPSQITLGAPPPPAAPRAAVPAGPMTNKASASATTTATTGSSSSSSMPKRPGLDYSKWDNIDASDDEDDDRMEVDSYEQYADGDEGDDDNEDELSAEELAKAQALLKARRGDEAKNAAAPPPAAPQQPPPSSSSSSPFAAQDAAFATLKARLTRNGAVREHYVWRQSEAEAELSILLSPGTRAKELRIELVPADLAAGTRATLVVHRHGDAVFRGGLAYPIEQPKSAEELPWEVSDYEPRGGRRVLRVTLQKEAVHNVVVWWERAFDGEDKSDTTAFPDRKRVSDAEKHQTVWREAHAMFREKVANRVPVQIDLGNGEA